MKTIKITIILLLSVEIMGFALKPIKEYRVRPNQLGMIYKELKVTTIDSLSLKVWFFPAQDTISIEMLNNYYKNPRTRKYVAEKNMPTVIICNGDWGNMSYLTNHAYEVATRGLNVVLFDWRGFGESAEWEMDEAMLCLPEFLIDYNAVIDFVKNMDEVDDSKIGLFGFSTGAYLSFGVAAMRNDITAIGARAIITSFKEVLPNLKKIAPEKKIKVPVNYPEELLPVNCTPKLKSDILLFVGKNDRRTPVEMSRTIIDLHKGNKKLIVVPNAKHGGRDAPEWVMEGFFIELARFYKKSFYK